MTSAGGFHFIASFWGEAFRDYYLRLSLGSLLAPGNLPSLTDKANARLAVCTTPEDWQALQDDPTFLMATAHVEAVFHELRRPVPEFLRPAMSEEARRKGSPVPGEDRPWDEVSIGPRDVLMDGAFKRYQALGREIGAPLDTHHHYALRIMFMSNGHMRGADAAFQAGGCAVFLGPDLIMADGTVKELERIVASGRKVVQTATLRFDQEKCLDIFRRKGWLEPGAVLAMEPREMVATVFPHMHPETACFEYDSPLFCDTATSSMWRVPGDEGILLHNLNYYPLLINFDGIEQHQSDYLDIGGTIDGKYVALHVTGMDAIEVIDDSDRLMLASFTPSEEYYYPIRDHLLKRLPVVRDIYKIHQLRRTLFGPVGDPVKRMLYTRPLRLHSREIGDAWSKVEARAGAVAKAAVTPPGFLERLLFTGDRIRPFVSRWSAAGRAVWRKIVPARPPVERAPEVLCCQDGPGRVRTAVLGPPLETGRWYWEIHSPNLGASPEVAVTAATGVAAPGKINGRMVGERRDSVGWSGDGAARSGARVLAEGTPARTGPTNIGVHLDLDRRTLSFRVEDGQTLEVAVPGSEAVVPVVTSKHGTAGTAQIMPRLRRQDWNFAVQEGFSGLPEMGHDD